MERNDMTPMLVSDPWGENNYYIPKYQVDMVLDSMESKNEALNTRITELETRIKNNVTMQCLKLSEAENRKLESRIRELEALVYPSRAKLIILAIIVFIAGWLFMCFLTVFHSEPICQNDGGIQVCTDYYPVGNPYIKDAK